MNFLDLIWLIPLFPAAGFVINGLFGKRMPKTMVGVIACGLVFISFIFSAGAVYQLLQLDSAHRSHTVRLYEWINAGPAHTSEGPLANFRVDWGFLLDPLSSVMILVVTGIGLLIHIYSTGYMHEEDGYYRFFAYLNLFMFSMLTLVLGNNYVMMFVGWEGVGLCSYLLIGYYFHKKSAGDAAKKAFVVNRVGDWGFSIGIMMIFVTFGTIDFIQVGDKVREGVMAGTLHVGDPLFIGIALGVGAFAAGIFHLMTHAFFKALLFLGSGSVIHALHHEQDMRKMGALKNKIPVTFWTMFAGTLAITGTPFLAGFFSKDEILWKAFSSNQGHVLLWLLGAAVAGMTAFYMFRLIFMTFFGQSRVDHHTEHHIHESPRSMTVPLIILAIGSVVAGYVGFPAWLGGRNAFEKFLDPVFEPLPIPHGPEAEYSSLAEAGMAAASVAIALIGFGLAYSKYCKRSWEQQREIRQYGSLYPVFLNKYYVDEGYDLLFVNRAKDAGTGVWKLDAAVVDGAVNGSAWTTVEGALGSGWWDRWIVDGIVKFIGGFIRTMSWPLRLIQTGYVQNYALVMILGLLIFIGYVLWGTS